MEIIPLIFTNVQEARQAKRDIWNILDDKESICLAELYHICGMDEIITSDTANWYINNVSSMFVKPGKHNNYILHIQATPFKKGANLV